MNKQEQPPQRSFWRVLIASFSGSVLEWYDFAIYGVLAPLLSPLFFPSKSPLLSLMMAYSVFALGYLVRPIGSVVFGYLGDTYGRKSTLISTVLLMSIPAVLIGLLPTYAVIGIAAPLLLIVLRVVQGLALGGELIGATTLLYESAPAHLRAFGSSMLWVSSGSGILLGSLVAGQSIGFFQNSAYPSLSWRLPFLLSIITATVGYLLRRQLAESPAFLAGLGQRLKNSINPLQQTWRHQRGTLLRLIFVFAPTAVLFYFGFIFMPGILIKTTALPASGVMHINSIALLWMIIASPLFAWLSERLNIIQLWLKSILVILMLVIIPVYHFLHPHTLWQIAWLQLTLATLLAGLCGPLMAWALSSSPVSNRYSTTAIGYNLSYSIFGGCAPLVATALQHTRFPYIALGVIIAALCFLALICFMTKQDYYD